ncbi:MAG: hypothetical protein ACRDNZ_17545 [Streptosporangiaceae bacterium]
MATPTRNYEQASADQSLSRREEMAVSGSVLSDAPWGLAAGAGVAVAGGDMMLHLLGWHLTIAGPLALGAVAFFGVAGGGALLRPQASRALRWAQRNSWRFAAVPGVACAMVVFILSMIDGGHLLGSLFTGLWHGAAAYGLTGLVGSVGRPRRARS